MLHNKVVVVTGASSGLGAELARQLSERGAVPVLAARSQEKLKRSAERLSGKHGMFVLDVTSARQVSDTMEQIRQQFGSVDILVNNAGHGIFEAFADMPLEQIESMMDVNYMGMVRCTKAVLPHMLRSRQGHIVNVASLAGKIGTAKAAAYSASKHAVLGFTNSLRQELRGSGVLISAVNPGPIDTPFFELADPKGDYKRNLGGLMLKPEKVAAEIVNLIVRRKTEIDLPWIAAIGVRLYRLFPRFSDKVAASWFNKK